MKTIEVTFNKVELNIDEKFYLAEPIKIKKKTANGIVIPDSVKQDQIMYAKVVRDKDGNNGKILAFYDYAAKFVKLDKDYLLVYKDNILFDFKL